jgi:pimeloyl-ACP methyl ester carboxylesterase
MKLRPVNVIEARLIFPGTYTQGQTDAVATPDPDCELVKFTTSDGTSIVGIYGPAVGSAPQDTVRPTLLFFYGNGTCLAYNVDLFTRFRALGFNTMIVDYPGFGMSGGKPSEAGCYAAADLAYDFLVTRSDVATESIFASGWSLGGAVAIDLAARKPVAGLATFSAFTSISAVAKIVTRGFPVGLLLRSRFDNVTKMPAISCPIMMVHGMRDRIIPSEMLDRLAGAARGNMTVVRIAEADHNDLFDVGGVDLFQRIRLFAAGPSTSCQTLPDPA